MKTKENSCKVLQTTAKETKNVHQYCFDMIKLFHYAWYVVLKFWKRWFMNIYSSNRCPWWVATGRSSPSHHPPPTYKKDGESVVNTQKHDSSCLTQDGIHSEGLRKHYFWAHGVVMQVFVLLPGMLSKVGSFFFMVPKNCRTVCRVKLVHSPHQPAVWAPYTIFNIKRPNKYSSRKSKTTLRWRLCISYINKIILKAMGIGWSVQWHLHKTLR